MPCWSDWQTCDQMKASFFYLLFSVVVTKTGCWLPKQMLLQLPFSSKIQVQAQHKHTSNGLWSCTTTGCGPGGQDPLRLRRHQNPAVKELTPSLKARQECCPSAGAPGSMPEGTSSLSLLRWPLCWAGWSILSVSKVDICQNYSWFLSIVTTVDVSWQHVPRGVHCRAGPSRLTWSLRSQPLLNQTKQSNWYLSRKLH